MQSHMMDPDLIRGLAEISGNTREGQLEFVFDDEPLEHILYGEGRQGPTPAGLYRAGRRHIEEIRDSLRQGNHGVAIARCADLAACGQPLSVGMCRELGSLLKAVVPQIPNPALRHDLGPLRPLIDKIWETALEKQDKDLQRQSGGALYRWYEHQGLYAEARKVLTRMVEINAERGDVSEDAVCRNNLGFEYLLEGRFQEAMVHFDRAVTLFELAGDSAERANSRSNYWICLFERGEPGSLDQAEEELEDLAETLTRAHYWQARKPFILLARISEQRGKLRKAVEFVKKAVQCGTGSGTRYPETDAEYLGRLESRLASCWKARGRRSRKTGNAGAVSGRNGAVHPRRIALRLRS